MRSIFGRGPLRILLSGGLIASAVVLMSPVAPVHAAPTDYVVTLSGDCAGGNATSDWSTVTGADPGTGVKTFAVGDSLKLVNGCNQRVFVAPMCGSTPPNPVWFRQFDGNTLQEHQIIYSGGNNVGQPTTSYSCWQFHYFEVNDYIKIVFDRGGFPDYNDVSNGINYDFVARGLSSFSLDSLFARSIAFPARSIFESASGFAMNSYMEYVVPTDATAPTLSSVALLASGTEIELAYDESLDVSSVPAPADFAVTNGGVAVTVTNVTISAATLTLTLGGSPIDSSATVQLGYTKGSSPIQDAAGNDSVDLSGQAVTNNSTVAPPAPPPVFVPTPVTTPPTTATPTVPPTVPVIIDSSNQTALTRQPGGATALVNGEPVTVAVETPADLPAAQVDPEDRSPAQVQALQAAADEVVSALGTNSGLAVQDTPTGAAITGLLSTPVPVEHTVLVETPTQATLFAAVNQDGTVTEVQPGAVIEVLGDGQVGVVASGLTPGETVEFVIMSTPTLLGRYEVDANGTVKAQAALPSQFTRGDHTLVVASESVQASLGVKVSPLAQPTLPVTGGDTDRMAAVLMLFAVGAVLVVISRRRPHLVP